MESGRGLIKALESWARKVTSGYRDVDVRDLSTSFRDGLAFCAIVHHYRPDLLDFESLSKENILENNSLAFGVAEKQLGVPALLDAEDMLKFAHPDRLSIITYLSQLRNCFENQNKVNKRPSLKVIQKSSPDTAKVPGIVLPSARRHEVCQVCRHRVFILERLMVDGKLYHTTCFRCHRCDRLLNPGAYVESDDTPGSYECSVCIADDDEDTTTAPPAQMKTVAEEKVAPLQTTPPLSSPPAKEWGIAVAFARSNLSTENGLSSEKGPSVKEKINVFEKNHIKENTSPTLFSSRAKYSPVSSRSFHRPLSVSTVEDVSNMPTAPPRGVSIQAADSEKKPVDSNVSSSEMSSSVETESSRVLPVNEGPGRVSRDIFKSSLTPLKLTLLPSSRKESTEPVPFSVPDIKSSYCVTLPRSKSVQRHVEENRADLGPSSDAAERRNSLESKRDDPPAKALDKWMKPDIQSLQRSTSSVEISSGTRTGLKSYTPVYRSLYSTPNLSDKSSRLTSYSLLSSKMSKGESENDSVIKASRSYSPLSSRSCKITSDETSLENSADSLSKITSLTQVRISNDKSDERLNLSPVRSMDQEAEEMQYPDDLNPFGDEAEEEEDEDYPDDLNPFGDEEDVPNAAYDESKNPFASDEDEPSMPYDHDASRSDCPMPSLQDSMSSNVSSPCGSLRGTIKKRQAPKPPRVDDIFTKDSPADSSFQATPPKTSSPKVRKNKPAPPPPPSRDPAAKVKMAKETDNIKLKMASLEEKQQSKVFKKKKRPAPPVPIPVRRDMRAIPLKEIKQEMKEIEEKQREYERQGREIELLIRDRDKDEEPSVEEEEYIMQLFELVNQKNALFRRQAELMYIKRSQRLEEQQYQIEKEIRQLMEKPDCEKSPEDRRKEEELTLELLDIVDQRNSIIDSIEMDRRRELEEDHSVQEQLEIKNGDLQITAEIKQKSGKNKKNKNKKKKDEAEKGTPKIKKKLFSKRS